MKISSASRKAREMAWGGKEIQIMHCRKILEETVYAPHINSNKIDVLSVEPAALVGADEGPGLERRCIANSRTVS